MSFGRLLRKSCHAPMTALRPRRMPNRRCWPKLPGSTASPAASNRLEAIKAILASSSTENRLRRRDEGRTMTNTISVDRHRTLCLLGALIGLSVTLGACTNSSEEVVTARIPEDYRLRHPIAIQEADRSVVIFVGHARGDLSASQRADVIGLARIWVGEGTGAIVADVPVDTPNARAAASSFREIRALLTASGVPSRAISLHRYHPDDPRTLATIRLSYPKIAAVAGPCGLWPEDLGPSIKDRSYF